MIFRELENMFRLLLAVAIQVFVLSKIHLWGYAMPLAYIGFIVHFRLNYPRMGLLLWGFLCGLLVDIFTNTPGVAAASTTLMAFLQPVLLKAMASKDSLEDMRPSFHTLGYFTFVRFLFLLTLAHHLAYFLLEIFSWHNLSYVGISCGSSVLLTFLLLWAAEHLHNRSRKASQ